MNNTLAINSSSSGISSAHSTNPQALRRIQHTYSRQFPDAISFFHSVTLKPPNISCLLQSVLLCSIDASAHKFRLLFSKCVEHIDCSSQHARSELGGWDVEPKNMQVNFDEPSQQSSLVLICIRLWPSSWNICHVNTFRGPFNYLWKTQVKF